MTSYNRFNELRSESLIPLEIFLKNNATNDCSGISFIDSTPLSACQNKCIHNHKVFEGLAQRGYCSLGFFFGFKVHLIVTETGQIVNFMISSANIDDRKPLQVKGFIKKLWGKLFVDKG